MKYIVTVSWEVEADDLPQCCRHVPSLSTNSLTDIAIPVSIVIEPSNDTTTILPGGHHE